MHNVVQDHKQVMAMNCLLGGIMQRFSLLKTKAYINGEYVEVKNNRTFPVTNPATNEVICELPDLTVSETKYAIECAAKAQKQWQKVTPKERASVLRRWYDLVIENHGELAQLLSLEQGKPITESRGEILYGASFIEWFVEEAKRIYGDVLPQDKENHRLLVIKQAIGVVAAVTPWNFPNAMITLQSSSRLYSRLRHCVKTCTGNTPVCLSLSGISTSSGYSSWIV